ncbi:hypothetical protein COW09_01060 [bacterium (Candidatus Moisslbacteria) CG12_big_fil_rev_8_21_14_0_65_36_11]|nr:sigma-70 family RNA polymerase sigma factor [Candidatus Kuenenbacteria bacterium]OIP76214.1 MAG: hypothetical protein AUK09_02555 [Parcubacteria group bacterium CG2_30_36_38]PIV46224.1 MAG: hypothetical protein COS23_00140 [bacterium (Candidatus Moisslbacteria) CG02_land_8_20_14_3_00_36_53]PIW67948.1 MAG: hypothetical protein COW09_01060 [bacterium (Candidatus Moisslbacteria) CG12_big_fil_rev_8_21_14_0_65_36_11]PJC00807.1 MAG: hypothetical protein CO074_00715 [bacterium (Candidatus Moisslbac
MLFRFTEKILIEQIRNGNLKAFEIIYREYEERIYRFVYFRVSNRETAQDLTSEVFIKILDYLKNTDIEIDNFCAFIYKSTRNLVNDFYRLRRLTVSLDEVREVSLPSNLEEIAEKNIQLGEIKKYFEELKPEYREPVLLHYFEGLSYKDMAQILGETEDSLKMRSHRGIKQLKKFLKKGA